MYFLFLISFAGNEVVNNATNVASAAYVRSAVRDLKSYIKSKNYCSIPVGYTGADIPVIRNELTAYLTCNTTNTPQDNATEADFLGYNNYEWFGGSNFYASGYAARTNELQNITVPIFFSEFGYNVIHPRIFTESGGIVCEFSEEQWATVDPKKVSKHSYQPLGNAPGCPARNESSWAVTFEAFRDSYNGRYGNFSGCTEKQQLSLAVDAYTKNHLHDACSWGGIGILS
ncbi:1,3-beta-glucanosyltransferase [Schizosaccharomyces cryophilus OY26]|uniref:1,3-beta-glucanosyltransferase n=1 Tax=Schizosaccharomyces cryophilus (strain OY26 / ATCC MYA-4695 / CBS 11777 / NBRC 106824 / NRRL Y48691) TaxID=653667 RepID=S9XEP7_SCHCR|nr:1,3-beta-glucanosyltransferase [Schizosaccharomyces cryophilus OY26]EPY52261.1 1,3-beta-glucanosyltransferase [Schizosaccharomyces cryophilus OY26]